MVLGGRCSIGLRDWGMADFGRYQDPLFFRCRHGFRFFLGLLLLIQLGCAFQTVDVHPDLKPEHKQEVLLVHESIALILSDDDLDGSEATEVMNTAIVEKGLLKRAGRGAFDALYQFLGTRYGLYLRFNRAAIMKLSVERDDDDDLVDKNAGELERRKSGPRWAFTPIYIVYPPFLLLHWAMKKDFERIKIWRHFDAGGPSFHEEDPDEDDLKLIIRELSQNGAQLTAYASIGIGAVLHLREGCSVQLQVGIYSSDGKPILQLRALGHSGKAEDAKGGLIQSAVNDALRRLSNP